MANSIEANKIIAVSNLWKSIEQARQLYSCARFLEAYKLIKDVCEFIDMMVSIKLHGEGFDEKRYAEIYMLAGDICGELGYSVEALSYYQKHQFFKFQLKHDFEGTDNIILYKFCNTRQYTLDNLINNEISLAPPRIQNDIVDCPIFAWLDTLCGSNARFKKHIPFLKKSFDGLRCASFCADTKDMRAIENTLMWAHYANSHKGICIEYALDKSDFRTNDQLQWAATTLLKIKYTDPNIEPLNFTDRETVLNSRSAYASKSIDWQYENEVRLVAYAPYHKEFFVQYQFNTPTPVKAIYFGSRCSTQRKNKVRDIFKGQNVCFYQMRFNPKNIHRLICEEC